MISLPRKSPVLLLLYNNLRGNLNKEPKEASTAGEELNTAEAMFISL